MASHVVVIDSTARRVQVKTSPGKYLSDVLEEACTKFGLNASLYGLKHQNKQIDLSRTIRLSGLSSGAKLELVQSSRSPSVVSVALQLPEAEARGIPNARVTDKFPSTTTLWLVLRKFEAGVAGEGGTKRNLTARGSPRLNDGSTGQGRLYYETPVIQVMGRELSSFTDLQKSLGQLGFNGGSVLLKLSFRVSETPLEEAMRQIEEYFKDADTSTNEPYESHAISTEMTTDDREPASPETGATQPETVALEPSTPTKASNAGSTTSPSVDEPPAFTEAPSMTSSGRSIQVFAPPTSTTPAAAMRSYNPADYTPTIEHAQKHQRLLSESSRNIRLPSEAEIAAKAASEQEKLAAVNELEVRIRFPDEYVIGHSFGQADTCASLYNVVRECLDERWINEPFVLRQPGIRGTSGVVPDDQKKRLIQGLGLKGKVLLVFGWDEGASIEARGEKQVLKSTVKKLAKPIEVKEVPGADDDEDQGIRISTLRETAGNANDENKGKSKGGMPKWLKGLSKK